MSFMKKNAGFTLVELIVVIAILGILATVAIPSYTGYIEKAQIAGDEQELHNVNIAFAAACAEAGESNFGRSGVSVSTSGSAGSLKVEAVVDGNAKVVEAFETFYPDADAGVFKYYTALYYNKNLGAFQSEEAVITALKTVIGSSNFNGHIDELTGDVSDLVDVLFDYIDNPDNSILGSGFSSYLSDTLGLENPNNQQMANAAVLYLAHSAANMDEDKVTGATSYLANLLYDYDKAAGLPSDMLTELNKDTNSTLASCAMLYATAEAIALKEGEESDAYKALQSANLTDTNSVLTAVTNVFNSVDKTTLEGYIEDGGYENDMDAYYQVLQALNSKETELKGDLGNADFIETNEEIQDLLGKLKG